MATALNSENYAGLNESILTILKSGKRPTISIYTNAEATTYAIDTYGEIKDRDIKSASFTDSYTDNDGNTHNPYVSILFKDADNSIQSTFIDYFTTTDYVDDHWYILTGADIPRRRF